MSLKEFRGHFYTSLEAMREIVIGTQSKLNHQPDIMDITASDLIQLKAAPGRKKLLKPLFEPGRWTKMGLKNRQLAQCAILSFVSAEAFPSTLTIFSIRGEKTLVFLFVYPSYSCIEKNKDTEKQTSFRLLVLAATIAVDKARGFMVCIAMGVLADQ